MNIIDNKPSTDPFPRQPGVVVITFAAENSQDYEPYIRRVETYLKRYTFDDFNRVNNTLTIYPRAVND